MLGRIPATIVGAALALVGCTSADAVETERADRVPVSATDPGTPDDPPRATEPTEPIADDTDDPNDDDQPADDQPTDADDQVDSPESGDASGDGPVAPGDEQAGPEAGDASGDEGGRPPALGVGDALFPGLGSSDVDVISYDVRLTVDPAVAAISGSVAVVADVETGVRALPLDAVDIEVTAATVGGEPAEVETRPTELLVELPEGRDRRIDAVVEFESTGSRGPSRAGMPVGWFRTTAGTHVLNEPDGARRWLPSNDHPSDKATWRFEIEVPDGLTAVANGELVAEGGGGQAWVWESTDPMPTYLVQVLVGDYEVVEDEPLVDAEGDTVPIVHAVPAATAADYEVYARTIEPQMRFFEERFGPYPLERYGLAFVEGMAGIAMETLGRSQFGVSDFAGGELGFGQQLLLSHELAHQWFGNAVSPARWDDIWLNESLTTYAEWLWLDHIGIQGLDDAANRSLRARQDGPHATGDPEVDNLFGFESYGGGAPVVHALRLTLGDGPFFELLRTWVDEYSGTSQTSETFEALAAEIHGAELDDFFDDWLYAADLPDEYPA